MEEFNKQERTVINIETMRIYLSGGITNFGKEEFVKSNEWRSYIKNSLETSMKAFTRFRCFNPNNYYNFIFNNHDSEKEIINFDLFNLRKSDIVVANFNDPNSIGTACELTLAHELNKPILGLCEYDEEESLHPWLKEWVDKMFYTKESLIEYIVDYYG